MKSRLSAFALLFVFALALASAPGCVRPKQDAVITSEALFAVAPFANPGQDWELLGGFIPPDAKAVDKPILLDLDALLADSLSKLSAKTFLPPGRVKDCLAKTPRDVSENRGSVRKYWTEIGRCAKVDYLLVPQVHVMRERLGGPAGSDRPAKVVLDLFVVDVKTGGLYRHFHFDEEQMSLADNVLDFKKFVSRGGKWITAMDLAGEAIRKGIKDMGL